MKAKKTILPNGLRIITVPMKDTATVAVYVLVEAGTKYESKQYNGISHFLEHVCFKGTTKRPSSYAINSELDSIGAQSNAFTSHEFTGYHARSHSKHLPKIVDILSDIYLNSTFPIGEIEKEKGVILEEINMYEDIPQKKASILFQELLYGDQPAGWSILGRKDVIRAITSKDFIDYRKRHYVASSTIVVVAGNCDDVSVKNLIKKYFANVPVSKKSSKKRVVEKQTKPEILLFPKLSEQTHLVLGVRAFPANDKRASTLSVLNAILGEGMSSRLFRNLRESLGICYYVRSSFDEYTDHGVLEISSGVDPKRSLMAVGAICDELKRFKNELVTDDELQKAKEYMIGAMYLGLETSDALAGFYGFEEVVRHATKSPKDIEKAIRSVTAREIQKVARDIIKDNRLNLVMVGKVPDKREVKRILKI